jgi:hypothetical protein
MAFSPNKSSADSNSETKELLFFVLAGPALGVILLIGGLIFG